MRNINSTLLDSFSFGSSLSQSGQPPLPRLEKLRSSPPSAIPFPETSLLLFLDDILSVLGVSFLVIHLGIYQFLDLRTRVYALYLI